MNSKLTVLTAATIFSIAISGCSVGSGQTQATADTSLTTVTSETPFSETVAESTTSGSSENTTQTEATVTVDPEAPAKLKEKLGADHMYQDKFIPMRYLYITEKKIVLAVFLNGVEQTQEIDRSKFARTEVIKTADFAKVAIFDVAGRKLEITVSTSEVDEIQSVIG